MKTLEQIKQFIKTLNDLEFKYVPQDGIESWVKEYDGFRLFVAISSTNKFIPALVVGEIEVLLPSVPNDYWLLDFDKDNKTAE